MKDEPPDGPPSFNELDFSEYHPLDHYPATRYCRLLPGGTRRHLEYMWDFKWRRDLHRAFVCPWGRHKYTKHWSRNRSGETREWRACTYCSKTEPS